MCGGLAPPEPPPQLQPLLRLGQGHPEEQGHDRPEHRHPQGRQRDGRHQQQERTKDHPQRQAQRQMVRQRTRIGEGVLPNSPPQPPIPPRRHAQEAEQRLP